ncbi:MAG: glycosyltransferase family 2 protein [Cytophagaceae bacterium]
MVFCSIITVVFNNLPGLKITWESIKNQTDNDWEWVIVDGGSSDGAVTFLQELVSKDSRVTFISEKDKGLYDAMNKGILLAKGKYLWFVNTSDTIHSNGTLAVIKSVAHSQNSDVLYGETMFVDENQQAIGIRSEVSTRILPKKLTVNSMLYGMVVSHQSFLPLKSIVAEYNLSYKCSADIDWVIKALKNAKIISPVNEIVSNYLVGGFSAQNKHRCWKERWKIYRHHYGFFLTCWAHLFIIVRMAYYRVFNNRKY